MKVFVFLRGVESPFKRSVSNQLMQWLNPNVNTTRGIRASMDDFGPIQDKATRKAADRSCKNLVKKILGGSHAEQFIIIDNESIQPEHWQSYFNMAEGIHQNAIGVGVEIVSPVNMITPDQRGKLNLQDQKVQVFKASMYKYVEVKNEEDITEVIDVLESLETQP